MHELQRYQSLLFVHEDSFIADVIEKMRHVELRVSRLLSNLVEVLPRDGAGAAIV